MTTTLTSDEREQRLKQIRKRWPKGTKDDVDFLLSLIDSRAADGDISHCALCEDPSLSTATVRLLLPLGCVICA